MEIAFAFFCVVCIAGFLYLLRGGDAIYQFPGFMAFTFVVFVFPQAVSLLRFPGAASPEALETALWVSGLCLLACLVGYRLINKNLLGPLVATSYDEGRLLIGATVFLLIALGFNFLIGQMSEAETGGSMWSGKVTIYLFFTGGIYPAIAIFLRHALRKNSVKGWILFAVAMIPPMQSIIFAGRRELTAQIFLTIGMVLFFEKRLMPPRWLVPLTAVAAMLIIPATGNYRSNAADQDWEAIRQMDLVENFQRYINGEAILELRNAALSIEASEVLGDYGFGGAYWDEMVWRFVPAQFLGKGFKDSLMIAKGKKDYESLYASVGYSISVGSTQTGMADSFGQFWYFGAGVFFIMALMFRNVWEVACQPGTLFAQLLYIGSVTSAMRAVTHQTVDFLPGVTYQLIFVVILYQFSKLPPAPFRKGSVTKVS